jgi:hypothetical protein
MNSVFSSTAAAAPAAIIGPAIARMPPGTVLEALDRPFNAEMVSL